MATAVHRLAINPYGNQYPDDNSTKEIVLQADGLVTADPGVDRHVLLHWINGIDGSRRYTQMIQLTGGPGNYNFYTLQVKADSEGSVRCNAFYELGQYTRVQRDQIITLAEAVNFDKRSRVNNCQTWMRDLLVAMVGAELLSEDKFNEIDVGVPLRKRVPEISGTTA
jgi:hypothetical protein